MGLGEDGLTLGVEEVVGSLPGDRGAGSLDDFGGITFPVIALEVVEVVAAIDASESPIEASLVFVVSRAKFSEGALAIGSNNRVEIGSRSGPATWVRMVESPRLMLISPASESWLRRRFSAATRGVEMAKRRGERGRIIIS